ALSPQPARDGDITAASTPSTRTAMQTWRMGGMLVQVGRQPRTTETPALSDPRVCQHEPPRATRPWCNAPPGLLHRRGARRRIGESSWRRRHRMPNVKREGRWEREAHLHGHAKKAGTILLIWWAPSMRCIDSV